MKIYNELESLGLFEWLSKTHNLKDTDIAPEYLDELPLNEIVKDKDKIKSSERSSAV